MYTEELIERYCEETRVLEDKNNLVVIVYGSRVTGKSNENSDLDILVLSKNNNKTQESQLIDGVSVNTFFVSYEFIFHKIAYRFHGNDTYYESVFFNGIILKDSIGIVSLCKEQINELKKKERKTDNELKESTIKDIFLYLKKYKRSDGNSKKFYYAILLDYICKSHAYMFNYSWVNFMKIYTLYTDTSRAINDYKLKLPPDDFRTLFVDAICSTEDMDTHLKKLLPFIEYNWEREYCYYDITEECISNVNFEDTENKRELIHLNNQVVRVEDMLLKCSPSAEVCYFRLLHILKEDYTKLCGEDMDNFNLQMEAAIHTNDVNERICMLEKLLHLMDYKYELDYDDYTL